MTRRIAVTDAVRVVEKKTVVIPAMGGKGLSQFPYKSLLPIPIQPTKNFRRLTASTIRYSGKPKNKKCKPIFWERRTPSHGGGKISTTSMEKKRYPND
jgi:hypothetical protein